MNTEGEYYSSYVNSVEVLYGVLRQNKYLVITD